MKALVTGGAGYVGSHTLMELERAGVECVVLDSLVRGHRDLVRDVPLVVGDVSDRAPVRSILREHGIGVVLHFAAYAYVGESVEDPARYYRNNVAGTIELLGAMVEAGVKRIVFSSTCATYGLPREIPIPEDHPQEPVNPYGASKLMIERMLADFDRAYGLRSVVLRYFNAAGADPGGAIGERHEPETHLIPLVLRTALGERPAVEIFGTDYPTPDGTCVRDYVHVTDLASAHVLGVERLAGGAPSDVYNLGNGSGFSVREVIATAERVTGRPIAAVAAPRRAGDPHTLVGSSDKARRELGWSPRLASLEDIIRTAWAWHGARGVAAGDQGARHPS
jgi:UDP-glucose 4-epimerase